MQNINKVTDSETQIKNVAKYALVTGGSRGIGKQIAKKLSDMGYDLIVNYLNNTEAAEETKRMIEANGGKVELLKFDASKHEEINNAIDQWEEKHKDEYISVLVNNAGLRRDNVMFMMPDEDWHKVIDLNSAKL